VILALIYLKAYLQKQNASQILFQYTDGERLLQEKVSFLGIPP
jgi:hypothetical protein